MKKVLSSVVFFHAILISACKKGSNLAPPPATDFSISSWDVDGVTNRDDNNGTIIKPSIRLHFPAAIDRATVSSAIMLQTADYNVNYQKGDSILVIQPTSSLSYLSKYKLSVTNALKSKAGGRLIFPVEISLLIRYDSSDKFPVISDSELLNKVQKQTFKYFWEFAHPTSGLARERNSSVDLVTTGGSGFGIMAIPVAINRSFVSRTDGLARMQKIVAFLKNTAQKIHGAFPHWLNGTSGVVIPFSNKDDGADLVETSYLMAGLLTARQYFDRSDVAETTLRDDINVLWNNVEWDWFRKNNQDVLYWHWSNTFNWDMNVPIRGWNECLVTYVLAASSTTHSIPATVYKNGWAGGAGFTNGASYYGYQLPLGTPQGGPLFFSHYSFLGINPNGLQDVYANYTTQTTNHTLINYNYCKTNPANNFGYSADCWGLTASDIKNGYTASSPTNDVGVIAPTAALSSFPYSPVESMKALKFFYYTLGDKIFKEYGFVDAFALKDLWYANSFLAIDQGPIIVMLENYRTALLWNLFTSCPEVKAGMKKLSFTAPYL